MAHKVYIEDTNVYDKALERLRHAFEMFPLTLEGLTQSMQYLNRGKAARK